MGETGEIGEAGEAGENGEKFSYSINHNSLLYKI
jgi:hypothetical protein